MKSSTKQAVDKLEAIRPYVLIVNNKTEKGRAIKIFEEATGCKYDSELSSMCGGNNALYFPQYVGFYCGNLDFGDRRYTIVAGNSMGRDEVAVPMSMAKYLKTPEKLAAKIPKPINVKLNNSYTATVKDGAVFVGCQKFSFEVVKELAETVNIWESATKHK